MAAPRLAPWVAALAIVVVVVGGIVRVSGAGLGCPDWPLCYGQVVPPAGGAAVIEFSHRLVAGLFTVGVAWLGWVSWRGRNQGGGGREALLARRALAWTAIGAVVLVAVQVVLGGLNVLTELAPEVGAVHVLVAMTLVGVLAAAAQLAAAEGEGTPGRSARGRGHGAQVRRLRWAAWGAGLAVVTVALGGYMRATGASLACYDWPLCRGRVWPEAAWPVVLHWAHRVAALGLGVAVAAGALRAGGRLWWALALYVAQAAVGALGVWWLLPPAVRVLHLGLAAVLVGVLGAEVAAASLGVALSRRWAAGALETASAARHRLRPA